MRLASGYLEVSSGQDDSGREFLRLEWAKAAVAPAALPAASLPAPGADETQPCSRVCTGCQWVRPARHWSSRGFDGKRVILDQSAWTYATCASPQAEENRPSPVDLSRRDDRLHASIARGSDRMCGVEGQWFNVAARQSWRLPRNYWAAALAVLPLCASAYATSLLPELAFMAFMAGLCGPGIWMLARRHL